MSQYLSNLPEKFFSPASGERRIWVRQLCKLDGSCKVLVPDGAQQRWRARMRDISEGGVGLFLNRRFEVGTLLILELPSVDGQTAHLLLVRVLRLVSLAIDKWFLGCSLNPDIDNEDVKALVDAAAARARGAP